MRMLMNQAKLLGQRVQRWLRPIVVIRLLARKLCLREVACSAVLGGMGVRLITGDPSNPHNRDCVCFRGAGSELGKRSERPRGKSLFHRLDWQRSIRVVGSECFLIGSS